MNQLVRQLKTLSPSSPTETKLPSMRGPKVVNLGSEFKKFWTQAQVKFFDEQLRIWHEVLEKPHQNFFNAIVWQSPANPKWEERKNRQLRKYFALYPQLFPQIAAGFDHFDEALATQILRFQKTFPDAVFDLSIYAAPSATFNGKGGEGGDGGDESGKTVPLAAKDRGPEFRSDLDIC